MNQVKIGSSFFLKEINVYSNPKQAFWRENIQNSVDAKSTKIEIQIDELSKSVIISDNGVGMNRDQLENIYFTLGETSKNDGSSVGGFGKARILCCFSQKSYTLETGNLFVEGNGSSFEIKEIDNYTKGVKLKINLNDDFFSSIKSYLTEYLSYCYLPNCEIIVDGEKWTNWTYNNKYVKDLSFGKVYTNKSKDSGLLVRVNGTHMFRKNILLKYQVIVEINTSNSRDILQSSRDGLVYKYQYELEDFITSLNVDKNSALMNNLKKRIQINGSGKIHSRKNRLIRNESALSKSQKLELLSAFSKLRMISGQTEGSENDSYDKKTDDLLIIIDTDNPKVKRVINSYNPEKNISKNKIKLLRTWKIICENVIQSLLKTDFMYDDVKWQYGLIFSDDILGVCEVDFGIYSILFNPCDSEGKMRYKISKKEDINNLISIAIHEVSHIMHSYHDENFASVQTKLTGLTMNSLKNIYREIKNIAVEEDVSNNIKVMS